MSAERDARRIARVAARELADAEAYLNVLEEVGAETRERVREQRRTLRSQAPEPAPVAASGPARMRQSPLAELFRATTAS